MKLNLNKAVFLIAAFCASVSAVWATPPINVTSFGVVGDGATDNRANIQSAINSAATTGGTVYFPAGHYNVSGTLFVPSNVRLQGMGSLDNCLIQLTVTGVPLIEVGDGQSNITFKDLTLVSTTSSNEAVIRTQGTTGISLNAAGAGISTVVIENVRIRQFTHGISATSSIPGYDASISNVKIRNYASETNEYSLYTKTRGADGWDVQNMNVFPVYNGQNGIFLELSGQMSFLQLSCAGAGGGTCAKLWGNGDTYFRNMHVEGLKHGFCVGSHCDGSSGNTGENASLLTVENSAISGEFYRATNLVSINNRFWLDHAGMPRYEFIGTGANSWVMSCGDVWVSFDQHLYQTTVIPPRGAFLGLSSGVHGCVGYYHSSVPTFAQGYTADSERLNGAEVNVVTDFGATPNGGGDDTQAFVDALAAVSSWGVPVKRIFVPSGTYDVSGTLQLYGGETIVGEQGSTIIYNGSTSLFKVVATPDPVRGITWRNLVLIGSMGGVGIDLENYATTSASGAATDFQIQGVDFNGFRAGILVHPYGIDDDVTQNGDPMFDSVSVKDADFNGNETAISIHSQRASNWNLENITVNGTEGIRINGIGLMSIRGLSCAGTGVGSTCVTIQRQAGLTIEGLSAANVTNALVATWVNGYSQYPVTLRNNDLTAGVYFQGRIYLNSVNNIYPARLSNNSSSKVVKFAGYREDDPNNYFYGGQSDVFSCNDTFLDTSTGQTQSSWIGAYTGTLEKPVTTCY